MTDSYIQHLTQQTFRSTLQDSQPLAIRHLTKKSIASGVKKVYQQVSSQKWRKVTELSTLILQQLDSSEEYNQPEPVDTSVRRSAEMDEMAPVTTQSFCEFYRSAWQLVIYVCDLLVYCLWYQVLLLCSAGMYFFMSIYASYSAIIYFFNKNMNLRIFVCSNKYIS